MVYLTETMTQVLLLFGQFFIECLIFLSEFLHCQDIIHLLVKLRYGTSNTIDFDCLWSWKYVLWSLARDIEIINQSTVFLIRSSKKRNTQNYEKLISTDVENCLKKDWNKIEGKGTLTFYDHEKYQRLFPW